MKDANVSMTSLFRLASGELYIDDGETFDYKKGHYLHRAFTLKDGVFASTSADAAAAFVTNAWIEKVSFGSRIAVILT